jgi:ribose transport system ATP-binding protein
VVMISSELPEILGMSDRVAAMYQGKLVAILEGVDRTEAVLAPAIVGMTANQGMERERVA